MMKSLPNESLADLIQLCSQAREGRQRYPRYSTEIKMLACELVRNGATAAAVANAAGIAKSAIYNWMNDKVQNKLVKVMPVQGYVTQNRQSRAALLQLHTQEFEVVIYSAGASERL